MAGDPLLYCTEADLLIRPTIARFQYRLVPLSWCLGCRSLAIKGARQAEKKAVDYWIDAPRLSKLCRVTNVTNLTRIVRVV